VDYPIPATVTDAKPELSYDPYATIIYNAGASYFSPEQPEKITADKITTLVRNERNATLRVSRYEDCVDKTKDYLIENYEELGDHADEIAKLLNIDLSKTIEVSFSVNITATISLPVGKDFSDLSEYDFDIELNSNESDIEVENYDVDIERMREE
jgi:hypothetical protein